MNEQEPFETEPADERPILANEAVEGEHFNARLKHIRSFEKIAGEIGNRKQVNMPKNNTWVVGELSHVDIVVPWNSSLQAEVAHNSKITADQEARVVVLEENSDYEIVKDGVTTVYGKKGSFDEADSTETVSKVHEASHDKAA